MNVGFSETQFVIACLHEMFTFFENNHFQYTFTMPTQRMEAILGYDAQINLNNINLDEEIIPIFLQFKVPEYMESKNAKERGDFYNGHALPYYRIHVWPHCVSNQHNILVDFARENLYVFYCTPEFRNFDEVLHNHTVLDNTVLISCRELPHNYGSDKHVITYCPGFQYACWHSKVKRIQRTKFNLREIESYELKMGDFLDIIRNIYEKNNGLTYIKKYNDNAEAIDFLQHIFIETGIFFGILKK